MEFSLEMFWTVLDFNEPEHFWTDAISAVNFTAEP